MAFPNFCVTVYFSKSHTQYGNSNFVHPLSPFRAGAEGYRALVHFGSTARFAKSVSLLGGGFACGTEIDEKVCSFFSNKYLRFVCS